MSRLSEEQRCGRYPSSAGMQATGQHGNTKKRPTNRSVSVAGRQGNGHGESEDAAANGVEAEEIQYWPPLKSFLRAPSDPNAKQPLVNCTICFEPLIIKGLSADRGAKEYALVLPCAHFVGDRCMRAWRRECETKDRLLSCPICRVALIFPECSHPITGALAPAFPGDDVSQVPLTVREGGIIPDRCHDCCSREAYSRAREAYIDEQLIPRAMSLFTANTVSATRLRTLRKLLGDMFDCVPFIDCVFNYKAPSWAEPGRDEIPDEATWTSVSVSRNLSSVR